MDLGEFNMEGIEQAYEDKGKAYAWHEQVILLKEAILKAHSWDKLHIS